MKKGIFLFLLTLSSFFFLIPGVEASPNFDGMIDLPCNTDSCKVVHSLYYITRYGNLDSYYSVFGNDTNDLFSFPLGFKSYFFGISTSPFSADIENNFNYSIPAGKRVELVYTFKVKANFSQFVDKDIYFKYLNLWSFNESGEKIDFDFLEKNQFFTNVNFGVQQEKLNDIESYYHFILNFETKKPIQGFGFSFIPKESTEVDGSIRVDSATGGIVHTDYYLPIFISDYFGNNTPHVVLSNFRVGYVDKFVNLKTKIDSPVIPLPDDPPKYDKYEPDNSGIQDMQTCDQDNILDRFSCYFENMQIFFHNIFVRIGEGFQKSINNIVDFFTYITNFVNNWWEEFRLQIRSLSGIQDLPGNEDKTLTEAFMDMLKNVFVPKDLSFLNDFKDTLSNKLGFIAEVPLSIIDFILSLATTGWNEFNSIKLPTMSFFGVQFWNAQEISLQPAIDIFEPYKYITDVLCVILCCNTLLKWYESFANGGGK